MSDSNRPLRCYVTSQQSQCRGLTSQRGFTVIYSSNCFKLKLRPMAIMHCTAYREATLHHTELRSFNMFTAKLNTNIRANPAIDTRRWHLVRPHVSDEDAVRVLLSWQWNQKTYDDGSIVLRLTNTYGVRSRIKKKILDSGPDPDVRDPDPVFLDSRPDPDVRAT